MNKKKLKKALKRAQQEIIRLNTLLSPSFVGEVDQVRVFRGMILSSQEIQEHYEQACAGEGIYAPNLPKEMTFHPTSIDGGVWYHFAGTYAGSVMQVNR